jgi:DHA3 family macrolide efflux protein-like MFS transporter
MQDQSQLWRDGRWKAPFFTIWIGQAFSWIGSRVAMFALIWWLTEETGSATVLAMATLFAMLPSILLGPLAGVYVDRWNRRAVLFVADSLIALVSLWLAYLFWSGDIQIWHVYAVMLIRELGGIFHWPAMQSSTSLMVPKEHLSRVSGLNMAMHGGLNIVGPALGAIFFKVMPIHSIMLIDVVTAAFAVGPLVFIAIPQIVREPADEGKRRSVRSDLQIGIRYVMGWRGMVILMAMAMVFKIALTPAFSLLPLLVTDHFDGDAPQLAALEMAFGIGVILGGLALSLWGGFKRKIYTTILGVVSIGIWMLFIGVLPSELYLLAVAAMFAAGMSVSMTDGPLIAVMQATIAPEVQGRVFMVFNSLVTATSPIGLVIAGPVTDLVGIQIWFITAGALCVASGIWGAFIPAVVGIEDYVYDGGEQLSVDTGEVGEAEPVPAQA